MFGRLPIRRSDLAHGRRSRIKDYGESVRGIGKAKEIVLAAIMGDRRLMVTLI